MAVPFAAATFPLRQLPPISAVVSTASAPTCSYSSSSNLAKVISVSSTRTRVGVPVVDERSKVRRNFGVDSNQVSSLPNNQAFWEDPDDGCGSESDDEDEEVDESNLDFETDWEEEQVASATITTDKYEEDLRKEVEQLLGLEERAILQQHAAPNLGKISTAKWSPLHSVALAEQIHYMDMLIGNGLDIDLVDNDGLTALHTAIIGKKESVISHLLRKGASPNVRDRDGASPLHYAAQVGAMQTVKLLIKYNVDLNAADKEGWTPLHIAIQGRNRNIAKVLLVNGADKTRRNKDGKTPLDLALCFGKEFKSYDLAKLLKLVPANRDL